MAKERNLSLDIIRSAAIVLTIGRHFLDNAGFYDVCLYDLTPFLTAIFGMLTSSSVPMFLMLSGYLCNRKNLSARYYLGILRVLELYLISSVFCLLFRRFCLHEEMGLRFIFGSIVNFYACEYGWYVMLYVGLFLMIPFLNLMYHNLETRRQKLGLVVTFFALSILPSLLNLYVQIYSVWWKNLYPLSYYFAGVYFSEFKPEINSKKYGLILLSLLIGSTVFNTLHFRGSALSMIGVGYDHFEVFAISIVNFLFLFSLKPPVSGSGAAKFFTWVSELSFAAYVCSWISDSIIYPILASYAPSYYDRLPWAIPMTLLSLLLSLLFAQLAHRLYTPLSKVVNVLIYRIFPKLRAV